jgi:hypothetical protein
MIGQKIDMWLWSWNLISQWSTQPLHHFLKLFWVRLRIMLFNTTFNNISGKTWRSVLLVKEIGVPGENHKPTTSHWQTVSHNVVSSTHLLCGIQIYNLVVIGTDCIGSC